MQSPDPLAALQIGLAVVIALVCAGLLYTAHRARQGWQRAASTSDTTHAGQRVAGRPMLTLGASVLVVSLLCLLHLGTGRIGLTPRQVGLALLHQSPDVAHQTILWELRVPRLLVALAAGAMFGLAGVALQRGMGTPLADLGALGIAAGGAWFVALWIALVAPDATPGAGALPLVAMAGCLVASLPIYMLSRAQQPRLVRLGLTGIALSIVFPLLAILVLISDIQINAFFWWTVGSLERREWDAWHTLWPWALLTLALGLIMARQSLDGTHRPQFVVLWGTGLLAGSAVGIVGAIGYIGLFGSAIARRLARHNPWGIVLLSAVWGGGLLVLADMIAQQLGRSLPFLALFPELPAGLITASVGLPWLLVLMVRQARQSALPSPQPVGQSIEVG